MFAKNILSGRWLPMGLMALCLLILLAVLPQDSFSKPSRLRAVIKAESTSTVLVLYDDSTPQAAERSGAPKRRAPGGVQQPGLVGTFQVQAGGRESEFSYGDAAQLYGQFLANLIGRYQDINVIRRGISTYQAGESANYLRTFYIGSTYGNPVPSAFVADARAGSRITWINYQIWNAVPFSNEVIAPESPLGFSYTGIVGAYTTGEFTATYNKVDYRGYTYSKYLAPMEIAEVKLERPDVTVQAWAKNTAGQQVPYAIQSGEFWYVADNPFTYIHETDRYLVFADLLGPMLGHTETCEPRALARMEDLSPKDPPADLDRMLDIIQEVNVPFAAATIPLYKNNKKQSVITWQQRPDALAQLMRVPGMNGRIFQHGYTHQYEEFNNPYGRTGDDFEFWRVTKGKKGAFNYIGPIPGQTASSALQRVQSGRDILTGLGLSPVAWVTPHYAADPDFYTSISTQYPTVMERRLYRSGAMVSGQFFPYPVKDVHGVFVLPETMGSVQPGYMIDRLMDAAAANRALHCPWAGHFFHAYTISPDWIGGDNYITPAVNLCHKKLICLCLCQVGLNVGHFTWFDCFLI